LLQIKQAHMMTNEQMTGRTGRAATAMAEHWLLPADAPNCRPVWLVTGPEDLTALSATERRWLESTGFDARRPGFAVLPNTTTGEPAGAVAAIGDGSSYPAALTTGSLATSLPEGDYVFAGKLAPEQARLASLGWLLGAYRFTTYRRDAEPKRRRLALPRGVDRNALLAEANALWMARDLINTPSNDMGPAELEAAARALAERFGASCAVTVGDDLLTERFPMIHAVGRASTRPPRLVDLTWGEPSHPKLTLVGKGICFDTGGLDIKTADGMLLMKKDMGGAAAVMALGAMIMAAKLPYRLRVLLAIAENAIGGNAFRPGDILPSRAGMTVEIGNTDAEGRLVLADAMALACEEKPETLITMATLTGAARVALGPDLPPFYCDHDEFSGKLAAAGARIGDPVWRMPFWMPYDGLLASRIADVNHVSPGGHAGSITAALFLKRFAVGAGNYVHFDIFGWTPKAKPWAPEGGEAQGIRALFEHLKQGLA
jgi:leucyl aminopeptidase